MRTKRRNTLTVLLDLLKIRYTKSFADKSYFEQPNNHNLYGLSKMFDFYNISNAAFKAEDKEKVLDNIEPPFVAHIGDSFNVVTKIDKENVTHIWNDKSLDTPREEFLKHWDGITMVVEADENSGEPGYVKNRRKARFDLLKKWALRIAVITLFAVLYARNGLFESLGINILLVLNILGSIIAYFLLLKDLRLSNSVADKLCTLIHNSDCNSSEDKWGSKIFGFSWSEIGFGYFTANILILLLFPFYVNYIALINIFTLPYTLWSVWYQKFKAKHACLLN